SYTYTLTANVSPGYPGSINALRITLPDPQPGVTAAFSSPVSGETLYASDPVTVEVSASAVGTSVDRVDLTVNGEFFGSDDTTPYTFDLGYIAEGALNLSATAYGTDASEDTATASVTVASPLARAWPRHSIDTGINGADGARTADVDGDGDLDLIVAFEEAGTVRIYENPGIGTAMAGNWSYVSFTSSLLSSIEDANLADLDGDGRIDFVASMEGTNRKLIINWAPAAPGDYWNNANWTAMTLPAAAGQDWMYSQVLDIDGLNGPDIVAGSKGNVAGSDPATVSWFKAPADPRVAADWIRYTMTSAGWIMSVEPQDMDGDGDTDIVISDRRSGGVQQAARWLENPGPGAPGLTSSWTSHAIAGAGKEVMFLDLVDLDGDGLQDVIIPVLLGTATDQWLYARRLDASGTNWSVTPIDYPDGTEIPGGTGDGKATISVDVDNDGQLDVVSSHGMAFSPIQGMVWGTHDGDPVTGIWTYHSISGPEGEKFDRIVAMDVDGDGDLDLVSTDEDESLTENGLGVMLYENPRNDVVAVSSPAELWRLEWFGFSANAGVAADDVDFDGDGLVNLLERAFGSDPTVPEVMGILPVLATHTEYGSDYLALSYRRIAGGNGTTG
ncbi:MAG: FG-GAP-like repeat-containing protein, partial [Oceanipulchritudo sp.]